MWYAVDNSEYVLEDSYVLTSTDKLVMALIIIITFVVIAMIEALTEDTHPYIDAFISLPAAFCIGSFWFYIWNADEISMVFTLVLLIVWLGIHALYACCAVYLGSIIHEKWILPINTSSKSKNGNAGMHDISHMDDTIATNPQPTQTLRYCFRCGSPIQVELCERCGYHNSKQSILLLEEIDPSILKVNRGH